MFFKKNATRCTTWDATAARLFLLPCRADTLLLCHPSCSPREQALLFMTVYFSLFIPTEQIHFDTFGQTVLRYDVTLLPRLGHCYFCVVTFSSLLYFCSLNVEESCISHSSTFPSPPANERLHARVHCLLPSSSGLSGKYLPLEGTRTRGIG